MTSFWDDPMDSMAGAEVPEPPKPNYGDIPDKAWVLIKNATREQKEGAQPKIIPIESVIGEGTWYKFKTGFIVTGGDAAVKPNMTGRYLFYECKTHRHPEKDNPAMPCGGQLYNLILDTLAPLDAPVATRWATAFAVLAKKAKELSYTPEGFKGDTQLMIATTFKEVCLDTAYQVIAQVYTPKPKPGKSFQPGQTVGSIEADLTHNRTVHKVQLLEREEF